MSLIHKRQRLASLRDNVVLAQADHDWRAAHELATEMFKQIRVVKIAEECFPAVALKSRKELPYYWILPPMDPVYKHCFNNSTAPRIALRIDRNASCVTFINHV